MITTNSNVQRVNVQPARPVVETNYNGRRHPRVQGGHPQPTVPTIKYHSIPIPRNTIGPTEDYHPKIAVLLHIYYDDLVEELLSYLKGFEMPFDLYVSLASDAFPNSTQEVRSKEDRIRAVYPSAHIETVPNRGKDIGGKLILLKHVLTVGYDFFIFAHDKQTYRWKNRTHAADWRHELLKACFDKHIARDILHAFQTNSNLGMCGARINDGIISSLQFTGHNINYSLIQKCYSTHFGKLPNTGAFIGGTMFWVRASIFTNAFTLDKINSIISTLELGDVNDPSNAHAMERIFGIIATASGYKIGII